MPLTAGRPFLAVLDSLQHSFSSVRRRGAHLLDFFALALFHIFNHVQLIGFLGKDPEKRQVRGNGANFTVLSVATQQSWKDSNDEWQSKTEWHRVVAFNRLSESIADTLYKGDHVLVDGQLVSSKYERENGKSKKGKAAKVTIFWSVRANSVRRLSRAEAETATPTSSAEPAQGDAPF
jgi:single-strand DNA-binding protein